MPREAIWAVLGLLVAAQVIHVVLGLEDREQPASGSQTLLDDSIFSETSEPNCGMQNEDVTTLLKVAEELPWLTKHALKPWTRENLCDSCDIPDSAIGVISCTSDRYVSSLSISGPDNVSPEHLPVHVAKLSRLGDVYFSFLVKGSLPPEWASLTRLEALKVECEGLSGAIPKEWSKMASLRYLSVAFPAPQILPSYIGVNGEPPAWIAKLHRVYIANADWSNFQLPSTWFDDARSNLISISLDRFHAAGGIPEPLFGNKRLETVSIRPFKTSSFGTGTTLPEDWSKMTKLRSMSLASLKVHGTMPKVFHDSLKYLLIEDISQITNHPSSQALQTGHSGFLLPASLQLNNRDAPASKPSEPFNRACENTYHPKSVADEQGEGIIQTRSAVLGAALLAMTLVISSIL